MLDELYPAIEAATHALSTVYLPAFDGAALRNELSRSEAFLLLAVPTFGSTVSEKLLSVRNPYNAPGLYEITLLELCNKGMLELHVEHVFCITRKGLDTVKVLLASLYQTLAGFHPLAETELNRLAGWLKNLSESCLSAAEPPGKWCLEHIHMLDPGVVAHPMVKIDQHLSELGAYRDDAHLAAWQELTMSGHAWELLTLLWVEKAASLKRLNQKLAHRGYSLDQTRASLGELSFLDCVVFSSGEEWKITEEGKTIRAAAEERTNRLFQAAFAEFSDYELSETLELLKQFRHAIP